MEPLGCVTTNHLCDFLVSLWQCTLMTVNWNWTYQWTPDREQFNQTYSSSLPHFSSLFWVSLYLNHFLLQINGTCLLSASFFSASPWHIMTLRNESNVLKALHWHVMSRIIPYCTGFYYRPRSRGDYTFGSVRPSICLSVHRSIRLSVRLSICLSTLSFKMVGRSKW